MIKAKICGITNTKDALAAANAGAWAVGFIFYKKSPRSLGAFKAQKIISELPPFVTPVGVFVNQKEGAVKDIINFCGINTLQFHGEETPSYCKRFRNFKIIKSFRVEKKIDIEAVKKYDVDAYLFDTYQKDAHGGTGKTFNWSLAKAAKNLGVPIILSGGLHYNNVYEAIETLNPYAVDTCSGVEQTPGKKNHRSIKEFMKAVNSY